MFKSWSVFYSLSAERSFEKQRCIFRTIKFRVSTSSFSCGKSSMVYNNWTRSSQVLITTTVVSWEQMLLRQIGLYSVSCKLGWVEFSLRSCFSSLVDTTRKGHVCTTDFLCKAGSIKLDRRKVTFFFCGVGKSIFSKTIFKRTTMRQ